MARTKKPAKKKLIGNGLTLPQLRSIRAEFQKQLAVVDKEIAKQEFPAYCTYQWSVEFDDELLADKSMDLRCLSGTMRVFVEHRSDEDDMIENIETAVAEGILRDLELLEDDIVVRRIKTESVLVPKPKI